MPIYPSLPLSNQALDIEAETQLQGQACDYHRLYNPSHTPLPSPPLTKTLNPPTRQP